MGGRYTYFYWVELGDYVANNTIYSYCSKNINRKYLNAGYRNTPLYMIKSKKRKNPGVISEYCKLQIFKDYIKG